MAAGLRASFMHAIAQAAEAKRAELTGERARFLQNEL
jgi:hypothetical protein